MAKLRLYHIREGYVEFLHRADNRVQMNKGERRPYVGIVLRVGDFDARSKNKINEHTMR